MTQHDVEQCVFEALSKARAPRTSAAVLKWLVRSRAVNRVAAKRALWELIANKDLSVTPDLRLVVSPARKERDAVAPAVAVVGG